MKVKLSEADEIAIHSPDELYDVMQRILKRDNEYEKDKEHFWMVGMNAKGVILYIELVRYRHGFETEIEPMDVYRIAVLKNAATVIGAHYQPGGSFEIDANEEDCIDRLIQVGRILKIELCDFLMINTENYESFRESGMMEKLEKSLKYVPTYKIIEQIRQEEKELAQEASNKVVVSAISYLIKKGCTDKEEIAEALGIALDEVEQVFKNTKKKA